MRSFRTSALAILALLALSGAAAADGFHSPLLRNRDPHTWASTLREQLGLDRSDSAEELPAAGRGARPAVADRLVNVLKYLQRKNVLLREFPNFNYDAIPGFKSETESILIAIGADAVPVLLRTLVADLKGTGQSLGLARNSDFLQRLKHILVAIGEPAVPGLVGYLSEKHPRVRSTIFELLRKIVVQPDFGEDVTGWRRWYRIWNAGRHRLASEVSALVDLLDNSDERIRLAAARALGKIGSRKALPALLRILGRRSEPDFLREAIRSVVHIGNRSAAPHLITLLEDARPAVRQEAVVGLRFLTHEMMGFQPRGSAAERRKAVARWHDWWERQRR